METSITEHHLAVKKTARYCVLGDLGPHTEELWIVCHGFGQLAREFLSDFDSIVTPHRVIVAPEALSRFYRSQGTVHTPETPVGATWMTSEDRMAEIADYIAYLDAVLAAILLELSPSARVTVLGFSQGGATISRWVAASGPRLERVVLWGALIPPEITSPETAAGLRAQPIVFVHGTSDRYFKAGMLESEIQRALALGIAPSLIQFDGGHSIAADTLRAITAS